MGADFLAALTVALLLSVDGTKMSSGARSEGGVGSRRLVRLRSMEPPETWLLGLEPETPSPSGLTLWYCSTLDGWLYEDTPNTSSILRRASSTSGSMRSVSTVYVPVSLRSSAGDNTCSKPELGSTRAAADEAPLMGPGRGARAGPSFSILWIK